MTFQEGWASQPAVDCTSWATNSCPCEAAFLQSLNRRLYGSRRWLPTSLWVGLWHRMWRECLHVILTVWKCQEKMQRGKLNESNSDVKGDMSEFSLITARSAHLQSWGNDAPSWVWLHWLSGGINPSGCSSLTLILLTEHDCSVPWELLLLTH